MNTLSKNSVAFVSDLNEVNINAHELYMTSFDVESLYTNVPFVETIDIIVNKIFINSDTTFIGLTKILFRKLSEMATTNCFFLFDKKLYKQCNGLGMGLPQSPVFANIFMSHYEEQWLSNCPSNFKPVFYRRYVDDTFVLFTDNSHAAQFLNYINRQHDNINFTMETECNNSLSFLDVFIKKQGNDFLTSVHRKPTFSGLGLSYFSFCTKKFKSNSILTLLNRAFNICSNYKLFHDEFQFLIFFFLNNGFPVQFIESKINKFLHSKYCYIPNNQKLYFSLPFFGHQLEKLKDDLLNLLRQYFPDYSSNIILVNRFTNFILSFSLGYYFIALTM